MQVSPGFSKEISFVMGTFQSAKKLSFFSVIRTVLLTIHLHGNKAISQEVEVTLSK